MVEIKNLKVTIKKQTILENITCSLEPGRITCFIGKSGAGKTTLLKSLVNLVPIIDGQIMVNGQPLLEQDTTQKIGYVFQNFNLFTNLTVLDNCIDPLLVQGMKYDDAKQRALEELQKLGMENFLDKYLSELSGGQQQRVAIARSLCLKPQILLLDEPTASLDPINTDALVAILTSLAAEGLTIGLSSQDMNFVNKILDRIYYLEAGKIIDFCDSAKNIQSCPKIKQFIQQKT